MINMDGCRQLPVKNKINTHAKVGIHPGWGMSQLLQQAVGQRLAKQFSVTCEKIPAQRALSCGLVNEVIPTAKLLTGAIEIAEKICSVNYEMMLTMKKLIEEKNSTLLINWDCQDERNPGMTRAENVAV